MLAIAATPHARMKTLRRLRATSLTREVLTFGTVVFVFETIAGAGRERVEKINTTVPYDLTATSPRPFPLLKLHFI